MQKTPSLATGPKHALGMLGQAALTCALSFALGACGNAEAAHDTDEPSRAADAATADDVHDASTAELDAGARGDASPELPPFDGGAIPDAGAPAADAAAEPTRPGYRIKFADEFAGPDGSGVDTTKWTLETGGGGYGNHEREYYTNDLANAHVQDGVLWITATKAGAAGKTCWYGPCEYTSARLNTRGKLEVQYGRVEARIQVPSGQGMWPAFWMLGNDLGSAGWPSCGEIDIMENLGREPTTIHGTIHGPGYSGANGIGSPYVLANKAAFSADFHVFAVEWEASAIRFYVDDQLYATRDPSQLPKGTKWVFDHPFFLLLNLAVGGDWPGNPDASTQFPQTMKIDFVRVYEKL